MRRRRLLALAATTALSGCASAVNALVPNGGYRVLPDLAYGDGPRQVLDLYLPERPKGPLPAMLFLYGGGWRNGEKGFYRFLGEALTSRGIAVAVADYRLYPEVTWPGFIEDGAAAFAWLRRNAAVHGLDQRRLFLMGHSAGAHTVVMLTLDERWLAARGLDAREAIAGTIGLAGPYNFYPFRGRFTAEVFENAADPRETQPATHIDGIEAPLLLANGLDDDTVAPRNATDLAARVRAKGGMVETRLYPGVGHISLVGAFASPVRWVAPVLDDTVAFVQRSLV
jgi:acetyl esterase/lipase